MARSSRKVISSRRLSFPARQPCKVEAEAPQGSISGLVASFLAAIELLVFSAVSRGCYDGAAAWPLHLSFAIPAPLGVDFCPDLKTAPLDTSEMKARMRLPGSILSLPCSVLCALAVRLIRSATNPRHASAFKSFGSSKRPRPPAVRMMNFEFEGVVSLWVLAWSEMLLAALPVNIGLVVWPSCKLLCHYIARSVREGQKLLTPGLRILELGGGVGLLGILIANLGKECEVFITDSDDVCLNVAYANIAANSFNLGSSSIGMGKLRFGADSAKRFSEARGDDFDLIVAGDVMYSFEAVRLFFETVSCLLAPTGQVLLAHPQRSSDMLNALLSAAEGEHGFQVASVMVSEDVSMDIGDHEPVTLYRLAKKLHVGNIGTATPGHELLAEASGGWKCSISFSASKEAAARQGADDNLQYLLVIAAHPCVKFSKDVEVDIAENSVRFACAAGVGEFQLPHRIDCSGAVTKWSRKRVELELRLPLKKTDISSQLEVTKTAEFPRDDMNTEGCADLPSGFPVQILHDEKRGRCVIATRDLLPGEIVLADDPAGCFVADESAARVCHYCFERGDFQWKRCGTCNWAQYCSGACYQAAISEHARECDVLTAWHRLGESRESCGLFLHLAQAVKSDSSLAPRIANLCSCPTGAPCWQQHRSHARKLARSLPPDLVSMGEEQITDILVKVHANAFKICDSSGEPSAHGLYIGGCMLNHNCRPNACSSYAKRQAVFRCLEPISKGDELCIAYVNVLLPLPERRKLLFSKKGFDCFCTCCSEESKGVWSPQTKTPMMEAAAALVHDACVLKQQGEVQEALRECKAVLAAGVNCPRVLALAHEQAAHLCFARSSWSQCLEHAAEAVPLMDRLLPPTYPATCSLLSSAEKAANKFGDAAEAQAHARQIIDRMTVSHGKDHPVVKAARASLLPGQSKTKHKKAR